MQQQKRVSTTASNQDGNTSDQKDTWIIEQRIVASMVKIHDDDDNVVLSSDDGLPFHILFDDDEEEYHGSDESNSSSDTQNTTYGQRSLFLFGGVDVSFPPPPHSPPPVDTDIHPGPSAPFGNNKHKEEQPTRCTQHTPPQSVAVYVVIDSRTMEVVYRDHEYFDLTVPYIPTFLAFREIDPIERLVSKQRQTDPNVTPTAILVDGNGVLHPRRAGIACFVGTRLAIPTIGIGKSLLYEGGWTRQKVSSTLDAFLGTVHRSLFSIVDGKRHPTELAKAISRKKGETSRRGLFLKRMDTHDEELLHDFGEKCLTTSSAVSNSTANNDIANFNCNEMTEQKLGKLSDISPYCNGICIPLTNHQSRGAAANTNNDESADLCLPARKMNVLGVAMIGHGGCTSPHPTSTKKAKRKGQRRDNRRSCPGSVRPLFVSVGHDLSLVEAIKVTARLSLTKIPEPIRQADLYGRELMRQQQQQHRSIFHRNCHEVGTTSESTTST